MNVFFLDTDPKRIVQQMFDRHVVKMTLETTQILSTVIRLLGTSIPSGTEVYKSTHPRHPSVLWAATSMDNWLYLRELAELMEVERRFRFGTGESRTIRVLRQLPVPQLPLVGWTRPPRVMPSHIRKKLGSASSDEDVVRAYRIYCTLYKRHLATWSRRPLPEWWVRSSAKARMARLSISEYPYDFLYTE